MRELIETLPDSKTNRNSVLHWTPILSDGHTVGLVRLLVGKDDCTYSVSEFGTDWGRGFLMKKVDPESGTDKGEEGYHILCGKGEEQDQCSCKGFQRWGHQQRCKHLATIRLLIERGVL